RLKHWNRIGTLEFVSQSQLSSYGQDHLLRFWDADSGRQTGQQECRSVSLCGPGACAYYIGQDEKLFRWDATTGKSSPLDINISGGVQGIKANAEGTHLVVLQESVSTGNTLSIWSMADRKELKKVPLTNKYGAHFALNHRADMLALTNQGKVLLTSLKNDQPPKELGHVEEHTLAYILAFTPDDKRILVGTSGMDVYQWEIESGRQLPIIKNYGGTVTTITFRNEPTAVTITSGGHISEYVPDGEAWSLTYRTEVPHAYGLSEGYNRQAKVFSDNGILLSSRFGPPPRIAGGPPDGLTAIDFSPDGRWLATGSESGQITLWETGTWKKGVSWKGHSGILKSLRFSHSGKILGALGDDGYAVLWDSESGKELRSIKLWLWRKRLTFSWDDQWLAVQSMGGRDLSIFDVATGEPIMNLPGRARGEMAFSPDRKLLVGAAAQETVHVWDIEKKSVSAKLGKQTQSDLDILFHPDGRRVLTNGTGLAVRVWDLVAKKETLALNDPAARGRPTGIALSADGKLVAAGWEDGAARIWDLESGRLVTAFQLGPIGGVVDEVSFSPDGAYLATLNRNGTAYVLSLDGVKIGK
ncbi:MAG: WD40 repeat domain-containing protein, partial [Planctomycetales bacterium]|nr:WD40 repeat domain-containing protein [Planctomycetales bacterium]